MNGDDFIVCFISVNVKFSTQHLNKGWAANRLPWLA